MKGAGGLCTFVSRHVFRSGNAFCRLRETRACFVSLVSNITDAVGITDSGPALDHSLDDDDDDPESLSISQIRAFHKLFDKPFDLLTPKEREVRRWRFEIVEVKCSVVYPALTVCADLRCGVLVGQDAVLHPSLDLQYLSSAIDIVAVLVDLTQYVGHTG